MPTAPSLPTLLLSGAIDDHLPGPLAAEIARNAVDIDDIDIDASFVSHHPLAGPLPPIAQALDEALERMHWKGAIAPVPAHDAAPVIDASMLGAGLTSGALRQQQQLELEQIVFSGAGQPPVVPADTSSMHSSVSHSRSGGGPTVGEESSPVFCAGSMSGMLSAGDNASSLTASSPIKRKTRKSGAVTKTKRAPLSRAMAGTVSR